MFESIVLRSLLGDGEYFNKCFGILKSEYFKSFGDQQVFKLIREYYGKYHQKPQNVALVAMVKDIPNAETRKAIIESLKKVSETELNTNTEFMCDETVKFIKSAIFFKGLELGSEGLMNKDEAKMKKAQALMEDMNKVQIDSDLGLDFDDIESQIEYYSKREFGIKTQHKSLNKRLGSGFLPGTLNVILAAQGVGKSLLMCDLISGMLLENKNILMVSLEMSQNEMLKRIHANVFDIDVNSFRDLAKTQGELDKLERPNTTKAQILAEYDKVKVSGKCGKLFIKEYPAGSMGACALQDLVDKFYTEKNLKFDIIFIDYLGIMKSDLVSPSAGLYSYVKAIGEEVRAFAVRNQIPTITASQLNRCFSVFTNVITDKGIKQVKDLKENDKLLTTNGNYNTIKVITEPETKRAFKIRTKSGKEIIVSEDHRIPTENGLMSVRVGLKKGVRISVKTDS